jgi:hypothetical protein
VFVGAVSASQFHAGQTKSGYKLELELDDKTIEADQVVVATEPFQRPRVPLNLAEDGRFVS